ncbi:MAG TPA: ABC transporter permease [Thermoanaerobaculia bacterium]|nr:ABC transporter permease [Thermoanaerobaculia bacterium]
METFLLDVQYALRTLRKQPGFTLIALATIALGIGANTAIFSILYAVLLRPLPYPGADRIVAVYASSPERGNSGTSRLDFEDWRAQSRSFSSLAAYRGASADVVGGIKPERVVGIAVSSGFFETFGVKPIAGRTFDAERDVKRGTPPAMISERFWKSHFGGRNVIGSVLRVSGEPHVIVGVLPAAFDYPWSQDLWLPLTRSERHLSRSGRNYKVIGRLKDGVTVEAAQAEMSAIAARLAHDYPDTNRGIGIALVTLRDDLTATVRPTLVLLFTLVALVLLIACANLANLLIARGRTRTTEIAIRGALGAGTPRLVRQLLTETIVLAVIGGLCGIVVAFYVSRALAHSAALDRFTSEQPLLDPVVLLFGLAISLVTAVLSGIVPALRLARTQLHAGGLQQLMRRDLRDPLRRHLVTIEVALSVMLLVAAGLLTRSMLRLQSEPMGFDPRALRMMTVNAPPDGDAVAFYDALLQRLQTQPGIEAIAASSNLPLDAEKVQGGVALEGRPAADEKSWVPAGWQLVNEDYFGAMKIQMLRGRPFVRADRGGAGVVIISDALARRYFPNASPLGHTLAVPGLDSDTYEKFQGGKVEWLTIVGVAADVRPAGPASEAIPEVYLPYFQHAGSNLKLAIRSSLAPAAIDRAAEASTRAIAPELPVRMRSYEEVLEKRLAAPKLRSQLILLFAVLAVVLAAGGMYGVTANWVEQRTREIGIRMAHGATSRDVLALFLRRGVGSTLLGIVAGFVAALWLARLLTPFLFRIDPRDPLTFAGAMLIALAIALLATTIPALRASRVNPVDSLRYE